MRPPTSASVQYLAKVCLDLADDAEKLSIFLAKSFIELAYCSTLKEVFSQYLLLKLLQASRNYTRLPSFRIVSFFVAVNSEVLKVS